VSSAGKPAAARHNVALARVGRAAGGLALLRASRYSKDMTAAHHRPHAELRHALDLRVDNLSVDRGGRRVIADLSFSLKSGEALKITGRNGVGKSTLLRALAGLLPLAGGSVALIGAEVEALAFETHYLAHADALKTALTVEENLDFWARYLGRAAHAERAFSAASALDAVGLAHLRRIPVGLLSAGQKRRIALAKLLVSWRPLWLLDEPLTALDARARADFAALMQDHIARGGLIVAATHEALGALETRELALAPKIGAAS
jgi:heme exporter protein A